MNLVLCCENKGNGSGWFLKGRTYGPFCRVVIVIKTIVRFSFILWKEGYQAYKKCLSLFPFSRKRISYQTLELEVSGSSLGNFDFYICIYVHLDVSNGDYKV